MAPTKSDTKDTLCNKSVKTFVIVLETLEMGVENVYMIRKTQYHKYFLLKQSKTPLYSISKNSHAKRQHLQYDKKSVNDTCDMRTLVKTTHSRMKIT